MLWSVGGITYFLTEVVSCNWDLVHLLLVGIDGSGFIKTSLSAHIVCGTFLSDKTLCSVSVTQEDNLELFQKGFDSWSKILCPMWGPYLCQGWSALCCSMIVAILSIGFKLPLHDFLSHVWNSWRCIMLWEIFGVTDKYEHNILFTWEGPINFSVCSVPFVLM